MVGQMAALLIGDAGFRSAVSERGLEFHGLMPVTASCVDEVEAAASGQLDTHIVILRTSSSERELAALVKRVRDVPSLVNVPLITIGDDGQDESAVAIRAGALHHLSVDCDRELLRAAIGSAVQICLRLRQSDSELRSRSEAICLLNAGSFRFRTPEDANNLAITLSSAGLTPQRLALGLLELLLNAVEHGNLGIGSEEKNRLRGENRFVEEVEARLALPENLNKYAALDMRRDDSGLSFMITDCGQGFDWRNFSFSAPVNTPVLHGRGILLARTFGFDRVEYQGIGNRVVAYATAAHGSRRR